MIPFINRERELDFLEKQYAQCEAALVVLYGRRRVGKTRLLREFIQGKPHLYFLADDQLSHQQIRSFQDMAAEQLGDSILSGLQFSTLEHLFRYLVEHLPLSSKWVLVIDEFQYLVKSEPATPSLFQRLWDLHLKDKPIMLILCGSLTGMMEKYTLNYSSPLYGRRTGQIKLRPLSFRYYPQLMPRSSVEQLMEFFAISGGVPKYMEFLDAQKSVLENIRDLFVNPAAYLYAEPRFLLAQEVRELTSYFSILKIIAAGNHKLGHIARQLGVETRHLTGYLKTLIDLDILERTVPVTEKYPEKSKKGLYRICDSVLRFWFRFIFPNQVYIESLQSEFVMKKIESDWAYFMGGVFEELITALVREQLLLDVRIIKAGQWWNRDVQIDLAALTEDNQWILGECKWLSRPLDQGALIELATKAEYFSRHHREPIQHLALFSRSGFTERLQRAAGERGVLLYDLETIGGKLNGGATG